MICLIKYDVIIILSCVNFEMMILSSYLVSCVCACVLRHLSHVQLIVTLWTVACQAPLSMGFSKQEYWSGLLSPPPGHLPNPRIKAVSLMSPTLAGKFFTTNAASEAHLVS